MACPWTVITKNLRSLTPGVMLYYNHSHLVRYCLLSKFIVKNVFMLCTENFKFVSYLDYCSLSCSRYMANR